jgi:hypothetical protein
LAVDERDGAIPWAPALHGGNSMALIDDIKDPAAQEAVKQLWQAVQALQHV